MQNNVSYLLTLNQRLARGLADWSAAPKRAAGEFILSRQNASGGFVGRAGQVDLYYTNFATRALAVLDMLDDALAARVATFASVQTPADIIQLVSLLSIKAMATDRAEFDGAQEFLETFRRDDGGYAKSPGSAVSSTYHTFLAGLCYDLLDSSPPKVETVTDFLLSRQCRDGGFNEVGKSSVGGVNPTAAAAALLAWRAWKIEDERSFEALSDVVRFMLAMQNPDGGFPAAKAAPLSDLLSTFTALLTLDNLSALDQANQPAALRFVESCLHAPAGFGGINGDPIADVEYTFYGIGAIALMDM